MNQDNAKTESAADHTSVAAGIELLKARQKEVDETKKKELSEMTAKDKRRLKTIEKCAKLLEKEEIPFLIFASIDETGTTRYGPRGWWQYNSLAYPDKGEDKIEAKVKKSNRVIPALFPTVLDYLSGAAYGMSLAAYGKDENLIAVHQYGHQIYPEPKPPVPASQETVDVKATTSSDTTE